jgi:hypothetical protein
LWLDTSAAAEKIGETLRKHKEHRLPYLCRKKKWLAGPGAWLAKTPLSKEKAVTTDGVLANGNASGAVKEALNKSSLSALLVKSG